MLDQGWHVVLLAPEDAYSDKLRALFPDAHFVPLKKLSRKSLSPWSNLQTYWELRTAFVRVRPNVVLLFTIKPNIFGTLAAHALGVPAVAVVTGLGYAGRAPWPLSWAIFELYRRAFRRAHRVVFQNHDDRREFILAGALGPEKAMVIKGSGIDAQYFAPNFVGAIPAEYPQLVTLAPGQPFDKGANPTSDIRHPTSALKAVTFIFVGRLLGEKGVREFVAAAPLVQAAHPNARFQILGGPDPDNPASIPAEELRRWAKGGLVEFLGQVEDVRPFIHQADAVVLPSYYREGMPRALLEGMAMGKPIITTDTVGCRDTVEDGHNGYIVPAGDTQALAAAMARFLCLSPAEKAALGMAGRKKVLQEFCDEVVLPQYLKVVDVPPNPVRRG